MLVVDTLVFDESQITSRLNYSHPTCGGQCHPLTGEAGRAIVVIRIEEEHELSDDNRLSESGRHPGSYNGQDAYNDLLITGEANENDFVHRGGRNRPDPGRKLF